jgi:hypothetical protein
MFDQIADECDPASFSKSLYSSLNLMMVVTDARCSRSFGCPISSVSRRVKGYLRPPRVAAGETFDKWAADLQSKKDKDRLEYQDAGGHSSLAMFESTVASSSIIANRKTSAPRFGGFINFVKDLASQH